MSPKRKRDEQDWTLCEFSVSRRLAVDGTLIESPYMVRTIDGRTEYRKLTEEEEHDYMSRSVW